ncbi:thioredoxin fold domain-containing protein [Dinghuibacter silviterrae]
MSSRNIPNGEPVMIIYFSPDCDHCQQLTDSLLANVRSFATTRIYFITIDPFDRLRVFNSHYHIFKYPNIVLGRDYEYSFVNELKPTGTPWVFIYNSHKDLKAIYPSITNVHNLINTIKSI